MEVHEGNGRLELFLTDVGSIDDHPSSLLFRQDVQPLHVDAALALWLIGGVVRDQTDREVLHPMRPEELDELLLECKVAAFKSEAVLIERTQYKTVR